MTNERQFIEVGKTYLVKDGDKLVSLEWIMNENVPNRNAAADLLDFFKRCADNSTWTTNTVLRIAEPEGGTNAQAQSIGNQSGNTDNTGASEGEETISNQGTADSGGS